MPELSLGVDASRARRGSAQFERSLQGAFTKAERASRGVDRLERQIRQEGNAASRAARQNRGFGQSLGFVRTAIGAIGIGLLAREYTQLSDTITQVDNRIRLLTDSSEAFSVVQATLLKQSQDNFVALDAQAEVFQRVGRGVGDMGGTINEALDATEALALAVRISGTASETASAALVQFGQGLAAGELRGQELRSVLEQTPRLARALAEALDTTTGQLLKMGEAGELTAERILPGLIGQLDTLREEAENLDPTFSQAFTVLRTRLATTVDDFNAVTGSSRKLGGAIDDLGGLIVDRGAEALVILADEAGIAFGLISDLIDGGVTGFNLLSESIGDAIPAAEGLGGTLLDLAGDTIPNAIALIKLFSTELVTFFVTTETRFQTLLKNFELADAQVAGNTERVKELRGELQGLDQELENELEFRRQNIAAILEERQATLDNRAAMLAELEARRAAREEALARRGQEGDPGEEGISGGIDPRRIEEIDISGLTADMDGLDARNELLKRAAQLTESVITPQQAYNEAVASAQRLLELGLISQETFNRALREQQITLDESNAFLQERIQLFERGQEITAGVRTEEELYAAAVHEANMLLAEGAISAETFQRRVAQLDEEFVKASDSLTVFAEQAGRNIQDAFSDFLFDPFDEGLQGLASNFADTLRKIASELLAQQALKAFFNSLSGFGGGVGSFATAALQGMQGRANGGSVQAGRPYMVGERGRPEAFVPDQNGSIMNEQQMGAMAAQMAPVIQNQINLDPRGFTEGLATPRGSRDLVNAIQMNKQAIKSALS